VQNKKTSKDNQKLLFFLEQFINVEKRSVLCVHILFIEDGLRGGSVKQGTISGGMPSAISGRIPRSQSILHRDVLLLFRDPAVVAIQQMQRIKHLNVIKIKTLDCNLEFHVLLISNEPKLIILHSICSPLGS